MSSVNCLIREKLPCEDNGWGNMPADWVYLNARTGKPEYPEYLPHLSPLHLNLGLAVPQPWGKAHTQFMMEALGYNTNCLSLLIVRNAGIYLLIIIMTGCRYRDSCRKLFINSEILPLPSQYILSLLMFMIRNRSQFLANSEIHHISTRRHANFHHPSVNVTK